jgi:hypothetical protein
MPGIMDLRENFQFGGGADMGQEKGPETGRAPGPGPGAGPGPSKSDGPGFVDRSIRMENIGVPGIEDIMRGNFSQFGPVTYRGAPQVFNAFNQSSYTDRIMDIAERQRRQELRDIVEASAQYPDPYEGFRNKQMGDIPFTGALSILAEMIKPELQKGMTYTRNFFLDKVLPAQRGMLEGVDFSDLKRSQQEDLYKEYMSQRLTNQIDAYGNPLITGEPVNSEGNPLIPLLAAQQQENLQGGVAQLYNQYMQNIEGAL